MIDPKHSVTLTARDRALYEAEFKSWLPRKIFDVHVHAFSRESFKPEYVDPPKSCYRRFGGECRAEQIEEIAAKLLPDQEFSYLGFGSPDLLTDTENASAYTGSTIDNRRRFGLALVSPKDPVGEVERRIREYKLLGYKPYRNFVDWMDVEAVTIFDMLTAEQMALANELGLVVLLHIPKAERLSDPINQKQMVELREKYPNAKIVYAHIGRAYYMKNVIGYLDGIARCPNAYIDTAMVNHPGVLEYAFNHFPRERILFGSDAPIAFLRGKSVEINDQYAYLMGEDYAIGSTIYGGDKPVEFTFFYYEQLRGVKEAAEKAGLTRREIEGIFYDNAFGLLKPIAERLER